MLIISEPPGGGVGVTVLAPNAPVTVDEHAAELTARGVNVVGQTELLPDNAGNALEYVLDEDTLEVTQQPYADQIRCFRNTWKWDGIGVVEDTAMIDTEKKKRDRDVRNRMLVLTDEQEFRLTGTDLAAAQAYRRELRDLGSAIDTDPDNVTWPTKPVPV